MSLPKECKYIGVFLTFSCQFKCTYCVNRYGELSRRKSMKVEDWVAGLSKISTCNEVPITLQGGEPTIYPQFYELVRMLRGKYLDLLTNFQVDERRWCKEIAWDDFYRPSKYASIRVSYHPGQSSILGLFARVWRASRRGYDIGIWAVDHPAYRRRAGALRRLARVLGIDFRLKEFLGWADGAFYGEYKYPKAVGQLHTHEVMCRSWELLVAPDGNIHKCHADLYAGRSPIGHILDERLPELGKWRRCSHAGHCNVCDIKLKTDNLQKGGHCSVEQAPIPL
jgi:hypothetical protein